MDKGECAGFRDRSRLYLSATLSANSRKGPLLPFPALPAVYAVDPLNTAVRGALWGAPWFVTELSPRVEHPTGLRPALVHCRPVHTPGGIDAFRVGGRGSFAPDEDVPICRYLNDIESEAVLNQEENRHVNGVSVRRVAHPPYVTDILPSS